MKLKNILIIISLFIFVFGISAVAGENVTVEGNVFQVPQGYVVKNSTDYSAVFVKENNSNYTIFIVPGNFSDFENAKQGREVSGFKFISDEVFLSENNISVTKQNYMKNESYHSFYYFELDNSTYMIGYAFPVNDDSKDQSDPVSQIMNKLV